MASHKMEEESSQGIIGLTRLVRFFCIAMHPVVAIILRLTLGVSVQ